jgi:hypothetical protein
VLSHSLRAEPENLLRNFCSEGIEWECPLEEIHLNRPERVAKKVHLISEKAPYKVKFSTGKGKSRRGVVGQEEMRGRVLWCRIENKGEYHWRPSNQVQKVN